MSDDPTPVDPDVRPIPPLADDIRRHVGRALAINAMGEDIMWDYSITPTEQGAVATLSIWLKGIIIGSHFNFTFQVNPVILSSKEGAEQIIQEALGAAREAKDQQMIQMQQQAASMGGPMTTSPGPLTVSPPTP